MTRATLERLGAGLRRLSWPLRVRLGAAGVLGLGLALLGGGLALWQATREPALTAQQQALLAQARSLAEQAVMPLRERPRNTEQALAALPLPTAHAADLRVLYSVAARRDVEIERGDFQQLAGAEGGLVVISATLPMRGSYAALKAYASEVLQQLPHVALLDLRLERADIGSRELRARLRLTMHYRRGDA